MFGILILHVWHVWRNIYDVNDDDDNDDDDDEDNDDDVKWLKVPHVLRPRYLWLLSDWPPDACADKLPSHKNKIFSIIISIYYY